MGSLKDYETVFILHPRTEDAKLEEEIDAVRQLIEASSGTVVDVERWGRRKLAYEIGKVNEGIYTLVRFRSGPAVVQELERRYRLKEDVLRHLTVASHGLPVEPGRREPAGEAAHPAASTDAGQAPGETGSGEGAEGEEPREPSSD